MLPLPSILSFCSLNRVSFFGFITCQFSFTSSLNRASIQDPLAAHIWEKTSRGEVGGGGRSLSAILGKFKLLFLSCPISLAFHFKFTLRG